MQYNLYIVKLRRRSFEQCFAFPSRECYEAFQKTYWYLPSHGEFYTSTTFIDVLDTASAMQEFFPEFYMRWQEEMSNLI